MYAHGRIPGVVHLLDDSAFYDEFAQPASLIIGEAG